MTPRLITAIGILAALHATSAAQTTVAQAEKLFQEGLTLMEQQQYPAACEKFEASQELDPLPSTLLNLAHCREKNGQIATAWNHFLKVKIETEGVAKYADFNKGAKTRAARLEARVSYLTILVPDDNRIAGLSITLDGDEVTTSLWNQSLPIDGGNYEIVGKAPGHEAWSTTVTIENEKDNESITVPRFKAVLEEPVMPPKDAAPDPRSEDEATSSEMTGKRKVALGVGAGGMLAIGLGAVLELGARGKYEDADAATDNDARRALQDDAARQRTWAMVAGGVGLVALGVAAYLWITGDDGAARRRNARLVPDLVGFALSFDLESFR